MKSQRSTEIAELRVEIEMLGTKARSIAHELAEKADYETAEGRHADRLEGALVVAAEGLQEIADTLEEDQYA